MQEQSYKAKMLETLKQIHDDVYLNDDTELIFEDWLWKNQSVLGNAVYKNLQESKIISEFQINEMRS